MRVKVRVRVKVGRGQGQAKGEGQGLRGFDLAARAARAGLLRVDGNLLRVTWCGLGLGLGLGSGLGLGLGWGSGDLLRVAVPAPVDCLLLNY